LGQLKDIVVTPLEIIPTPGGSVLHVLKSTDHQFTNFGEAYFSKIDHGAIKGWKKHLLMTMNIVVPHGLVKFVFTEDLINFKEIVIGDLNYKRVTVPPNIWFCFKGLYDPYSLVLNVADICHHPNEIEVAKLLDIKFNWDEK
jgi:dTDP-4-dehydrorhamnose 3,5-epimerase